MKLMKAIKRTVAAMVATLLLLVGMASAAFAVTYGHYYQWLGNGRCAAIKTVDYNWMEETFQGKRDYSYTWYTYQCNFGV